MHTHNSKARTEQRRTEAKERNERNAADVIACSCGRRHHREWSGCPLIVEARS